MIVACCLIVDLRHRLGSWQSRRMSVPPPGGRLGGDAAALLAGDLAHDRQAQPRARPPARLGAAVEAVEDVWQVLG